MDNCNALISELNITKYNAYILLVERNLKNVKRNILNIYRTVTRFILRLFILRLTFLSREGKSKQFNCRRPRWTKDDGDVGSK